MSQASAWKAGLCAPSFTTAAAPSPASHVRPVHSIMLLGSENAGRVSGLGSGSDAMGAATKEELHSLVDQLPESELSTARRLLEALRLLGQDPRQVTLDMAPWDDESTSPEEEAGVAVARQEIARGEVISAEEAKRRLLA